jgi:hypothetical protein
MKRVRKKYHAGRPQAKSGARLVRLPGPVVPEKEKGQPRW